MSHGNLNMREQGVGPIRLGVSACLLGAPVRYDGGHKQNRFITELLAEHFELKAFCPEVAIGMGTPRPTIRLVGDAEHPRAVGSKDADLDVTDELRAYSTKTAQRLDDLCGFVLKKGSPTCGMERVKVYSNKGMPYPEGVGLFAAEIMKANPLLPVEEEGRLCDPVLRENFINRVYVYARWQALLGQGLSKHGLVQFHSRHKLLVMAHSNTAYRELGRLLSDLNAAALDEIAGRYIKQLMEALRQRATRKRHSNVLQHLVGYLRRKTDSDDRIELVQLIDAYRRGEYPLVVPVNLLRHHFRRHPDPYISGQVYLDPYPSELMLRNAV